MVGQRVEQLGIRRGVGFAEIVLGFDEPSLEEVLPVTIDQRLGEERIRRVAHPVGELQTRVFILGDGQGLTSQHRRFQRNLGLLVFELSHAPFVKDHVLAPRRRWLPSDTAEEGPETVIVVLAPAFERMMMALRALHSHAEK